MSDNGKPGAGAATDQGFELAKWAALVAMTADHFGKIVMPEWFDATHAIGRLAYPLFAGIIGLRLAARPERAESYLRRLLPWALLSQPIFVLAGRQWSDLNIMATLLVGVLAVVGAAELRENRRLRGSAMLAVALAATPFVEFGPVGPWIIPIIAWFAGRDSERWIWMVGPLGVAANLLPASPYLELVDCCALGASPVLWLSLRASTGVRRMPTQAFYAYYPLHLLLLDRIDRWFL